MRDSSSRVAVVSTGVVLVLATFWVWRGAFALPLLGWDTYPLIAAGRIESVGDVFSVFGDELMDGRYPLGHYWRPLVHLLFGVDGAVSGLSPLGYHVTDVALVAISAVLVATVLRRLARPGLPRVGPLVAGLVFALHPAQFDVVTVPARRAESLAILFTLAAIAVACGKPGAVRGTAKRAALVAGCLAACALASKETGAVALPLVWLVLVTRGACSFDRRLVAIALATAVFALAFLVRAFALDGIGGGDEAALGLGVPRAARTLARYVVASGGSTTVQRVLVALAIALLVGWTGRARELIVFAFLWWVALALFTGMAGIDQAWYALPFVPATACLLGCAAGEAWGRVRAAGEAASPAARFVGGVAFVPPVLWIALAVPHAGIGPAADDFAVVGAETERFLDAFGAEVAAAAPGSELRLEAAFEWVVVDADDAPLLRIHPFAPYSLEAWSELALPNKRVRVSTPARASLRPAREGDVRVVLRNVPRIHRRRPAR